MITMSIDPGTTHSAYVTLLDNQIMCHEEVENNKMLVRIMDLHFSGEEEIACEMVAHYGQGMAVGKEVFETCVWIGRFMQEAAHNNLPFYLVYRGQVKHHLCGSAKAKDGNIRQALIDRLGPQGTKKNPGPTYGISCHKWQALAVGITWQAMREQLIKREYSA